MCLSSSHSSPFNSLVLLLIFISFTVHVTNMTDLQGMKSVVANGELLSFLEWKDNGQFSPILSREHYHWLEFSTANKTSGDSTVKICDQCII